MITQNRKGKTMQKNQHIYDQVTNKIIASLEKGVAPWVCPWNKESPFPINASTGKRYNGINVILTWIAEHENNFQTSKWLTFKQAKALGGHVRKGEKGTSIVFFKMIEKETDGETERFPCPKGYTVFNVSQCDGLPDKVTGKHETTEGGGVQELKRSDLQKFVSDTGAIVRHEGDRAYYSIDNDSVTLPELEKFHSEHGYWATALHELTHWTGAKHRLDRQYGKRFGDAAYAAEELVAEMGSAFMCRLFNVEGELRHAGYIENWLKALRSNRKLVFTAASAASKASDYLQTLATVKLPKAA
jgi:antirestriction protein ArdC